MILPLGFAGGIVDRDTGLIRFGYRDYDPDVGRFIAPDPLGAPAVGESSSLTDGDSRDEFRVEQSHSRQMIPLRRHHDDTGGDHDPWEYCVDDPVNMVDPKGLFGLALPLLFMGGKALAGGLAAAGLFGASKAVGDPEVTANVGDKEVKGKLSNMTAGAAAAAAGATGLAGAGAMAAPEAVSMAAPHVTQGIATGAAAVSRAAKDPRVQDVIQKVGDVVAGTLPTPPPETWEGQLGFAGKAIVDEIQYQNRSTT